MLYTEDAEAIFSYRSDCIVNQYQGWIPNSIEEVRRCIINMPETIDVANLYIQFVVLNLKENRLIGDMAISFSNHDNMQAEIGCTLDKAFQNKGYATEAMKGMVDYLFQQCINIELLYL